MKPVSATETEGVQTRFSALKMTLNVLEDGRSLSSVLPEGLAQFDGRERGFVQNLVLGTLRWQLRLEGIRSQLIKKPLKAKDEDVNQLIIIGLFQILYTSIPAHAAVSSTVEVTKRLKKPWARGVVNGVLRNFMRNQEEICAAADVKPSIQFSHPQWFFKAVRKAYPEAWQTILSANNEIAPLTLRNNIRSQPLEQYSTLLDELNIAHQRHPLCQQGIMLEQSCDIAQLPGFEDGAFSVQDGAAQQAGQILAPQIGERILDACAAPGGKTSHILEYSDNKANVLALEKEPERIERLAENLYRLDLQCDYQVADARDLDAWWDQQPFDKILLDAPCSATGIIRRHPDIKWHRTEEDIQSLTEIQADILQTLWTTLKPNGHLLYATCSVLPQENSDQIKAFVQNRDDVEVIQVTSDKVENVAEFGWQILPGQLGMDGFYYCLLKKLC